MQYKSSSLSALTMNLLVLPEHTNPYSNMHGGEMMKLMDNAAGVVAVRYSAGQVVTASVDSLVFKEPIRLGDLVLCDAEVIYTGKTTIGVYVAVKVENIASGETKPALEGYWFFVAVDANERPRAVPPLKIETVEQERLFAEAGLRLQRLRQA
ncbi:MAG: acyl-CoA thioesterase [Syntrophomonas sp.]|nr:acyl-CoA thioesterase [Syntrophomonas sp.]